METLQQIGERWGTDKATVHSYLPIYEELLGHLRGAPLRILEVGAGWSMPMWKTFFPRCVLTVIDKDYPKGLKQEPWFNFIVMRQEDEEQLSRFRGHTFDIIIDDGSHESPHQLMTCHALWQCLAPGGYYFIEDIIGTDRLPYWEMMPGYKVWTPLKGGRCDDILIMLRKPMGNKCVRCGGDLTHCHGCPTDVELTREDYACEICQNPPDDDGWIEHGKGCYVEDRDGGGTTRTDFRAKP